jgi:PadR family transcriptional regulator, regulatory protein PadR
VQCMAAAEGPTAMWLRGLLDVCLLAVIEDRPLYGYEMTRRLAEAGLDVVSEGSIYPALARLEKAGLISSFRQPSAEGPPRKYYRLSEEGVVLLGDRRRQWDDFTRAVTTVLEKGERT